MPIISNFEERIRNNAQKYQIVKSQFHAGKREFIYYPDREQNCEQKSEVLQSFGFFQVLHLFFVPLTDRFEKLFIENVRISLLENIVRSILGCRCHRGISGYLF